MHKDEIPVIRPQDGDLLGFVVKASSENWEARTVFGYVISRTTSQAEAESVVREEGPGFLKGVWQYFDKDDSDWYPCIIKSANQVNVTVIRTDAMGFQHPDSYKLVTIQSPDDTRLIKA